MNITGRLCGRGSCMPKYICVDLKSFYASCECVLRGLDPLTTPLVVADESRGNGTIILATSIYLKREFGVPGRCRLYELPKDIPLIIAIPRMRKYIDFSTKVYECFLQYFSPDDIHVYSIDEAFINVEPYYRLYEKTGVEMGRMIVEELKTKLGLPVSCGVGDNMFLAKIALDILAKKTVDGIAYLDRDKFINQLWYHQPISNFWQIGNGISKKLEGLGLYNLHDVAFYGRDRLVKEFGVIGNDLYDHAWGDDDISITDIKKYSPKAKSISSGQALFRDYTKQQARIVLLEMIYALSLDLIKKKMKCSSISLSIGYSKNSNLGMQKSLTLPYEMQNYNRLKEFFLILFDYVEDIPIRKINIAFYGLTDGRQLSVFEEDNRIYETINNLCQKYGKQAIMLGISLEKDATQKSRNSLIGGHHE